ncbi:hypothetical protein HDV01_001357 [Terramyces sp. JEL0728]|nr:hypothetical protein HDV01_001357 [Terramyces sp. JEL0728]
MVETMPTVVPVAAVVCTVLDAMIAVEVIAPVDVETMPTVVPVAAVVCTVLDAIIAVEVIAPVEVIAAVACVLSEDKVSAVVLTTAALVDSIVKDIPVVTSKVEVETVAVPRLMG